MSLSSSSSSLACVRPDRVEGKKKSISKKHLYRSKASRQTRLIRLFIIFCKRDMTIHTQCVRARIPEMSTKYVHWPCPQVGPHSSELYNGTRKSYTLYYYYIPLIYVCVYNTRILKYIYIYLNIISCKGRVCFCRETGRAVTNREEFSIFPPDCSYNRVYCFLGDDHSSRAAFVLLWNAVKKRQISSHFL